MNRQSYRREMFFKNFYTWNLYLIDTVMLLNIIIRGDFFNIWSFTMKWFSGIKIIILFIMLLPIKIGGQETIRIAVGEWSPYISEDLEHFGVVCRIMTEAFSSQGYKVEYGFFPWKRSLEYVKTGEWDATGAWAFSEDREPYFLFSDPILEVTQVLFHLKSTHLDWDSIEDLADLKIGATIGYDYGELFETAEKEGIITVRRNVSDESSFRLLLRGGIHAFACNSITGKAILKKNFTEEQVALVVIHPKPLDIKLNRLLFSKVLPNSELLLEKFNAGLMELRRSGKYDLYFQESIEGKYERNRLY